MAVYTACSGGARPAAPGGPVSVRIGTFVPPAQVRNLVSVFSSEPLVSVDWEGRPEFRVAESAIAGEDGLSLTVRLRPDLTFHNGERVTASAVRALLQPTLLLRTREISGADVPDDRTLIIRLRRPHSLKPVDLFSYTLDDDKRPELRTGPFKIVSLDPAPRLVPVDPKSHSAGAIEEIEIKLYPTHRAAWTAMMRREVNFLHEVSREAIEFVEAGGDILVFNVKHPILRRPEVRIALNEAINREEIVRNGMRGHGEAVEGPFWPHHWAYPRGRYPVIYNPEAARVRLDAAGLRVVDHRNGRAPSRAHFTCLLLRGDNRFERIALVVQRQLSAIGVDMELRLVPQDALVRQITSRDFEAFIFEMSTARTLSFPYDFWHSQGARAMSGYSGADAALDRMKLAQSDDEVRLAVSEVMRAMRADPPAAFLVMAREARAADKAFEIPYEPDRDVFGRFLQLRRAPAQVAGAR
jgi:peptide/nickel transport system substrate-binding protein